MARRRLRAAATRARCLARVERLATLPPSLWLDGRSAAQVAESGSIPWAFTTMTAEAWRARFPGLEAPVRAAADALLVGRVRLFERDLDLALPGGGMNWRFDPLEGELAPFHGDPKMPWEIARLALMPRLGTAWWLTGDTRYPRRAAALLLDWAAREPVAPGPHYASALEVGVRLIALCQTFQFFRRAEAFEGTTMETLLRQVALQAAWLEGHLSDERLVAGNHLLGELAGLVVVDLTFPEIAAAEAEAHAGHRRLDYALQLFRDEVMRQTFVDGVSREQSTTYGRFVADFVLAVLATARAAGRALPDALAARGGALAHWLAAATQPDGTLPLIGDNDCGRGADWGEPGPFNDARGPLRALAVLADDPSPLAFDARPAATAAPGAILDTMSDAVVAWWLGERGLLQLGELRRRAPAPPPVTLFAAGGHAALRAGDDYAYVRCGPFGHGLPKPCAHSHADFMAPVLWLGGAPLLVDPGNWGYTKAGPERAAFQADAAHSVFLVEGIPLGAPYDAFRWRLIPPDGTLADASPEDDGEWRLAGHWRPAGRAGRSLTASRAVIYTAEPRAFRCEDAWEFSGGAATVGVVWHWRFAPGAQLAPAPGDAWLIRRAGAADVRMSVEALPDSAGRPVGALSMGSVAPHYAARLPAPRLTVTWAVAPARGARLITRFALEP